jgi:hypothetical protein
MLAVIFLSVLVPLTILVNGWFSARWVSRIIREASDAVLEETSDQPIFPPPA